MSDRCVNCGSTDPFPRRRILKLAFLFASLVFVAVSAYYFYERAQELKKAEERAKAVGERVYETRPEAAADPITGQVAPAGL